MRPKHITKTQHTASFGVLILVALVFAPISSFGQADPSWLRSYNEAQEHRPETLTSHGRIALEDEAGIPMVIHGQVFGPKGMPAGGVVVHAYHRDSNGLDFGPGDNTLTTWRLQGWAETDEEGRFEFETIRPAADHLGREAAHVHFTLESGDFGRQWAPSLVLSDDPLVTARERRRSERAGNFAWVQDVQAVDGVQHVEMKIQLKENGEF